MTETLYRKTWEPLAEADKSAPQVVRPIGMPESIQVVDFDFKKQTWGAFGFYIKSDQFNSYEFLCLEPVEVETDEFPKVI